MLAMLAPVSEAVRFHLACIGGVSAGGVDLGVKCWILGWRFP